MTDVCLLVFKFWVVDTSSLELNAIIARHLSSSCHSLCLRRCCRLPSNACFSAIWCHSYTIRCSGLPKGLSTMMLNAVSVKLLRLVSQDWRTLLKLNVRNLHASGELLYAVVLILLTDSEETLRLYNDSLVRKISIEDEQHWVWLWKIRWRLSVCDRIH